MSPRVNVDNFRSDTETPAFTAGVTHFGKLLKSLREGRGLSQVKLAGKAGVSTFTIQRAEKSAKSNLRRSNALLIFNALSTGKPPLQGTEAEVFLQLAGLDRGLAEVHPMMASLREQSERAREVFAAADARQAELLNDPDVVTAHDIVQAMIEERGAKNTLAGLEGLCAAWGIDPPPRHDRKSVEGVGRWIFERAHLLENREVRVIERTGPTQAVAIEKSKAAKRSKA